MALDIYSNLNGYLSFDSRSSAYPFLPRLMRLKKLVVSRCLQISRADAILY